MAQSKNLIYDYVTGDIIDLETGLVVGRIYDYSGSFIRDEECKRRRLHQEVLRMPPDIAVFKAYRYIRNIIAEMKVQELEEKAKAIALRAYRILKERYKHVESKPLGIAAVYLTLLLEQGYVTKKTLNKMMAIVGFKSHSKVFNYIAILRRYFGVKRTRKQLKEILKNVLEELGETELYPRIMDLTNRIPEQIIKEHKLNIIAATILALTILPTGTAAKVLETRKSLIFRMKKKLKQSKLQNSSLSLPAI